MSRNFLFLKKIADETSPGIQFIGLSNIIVAVVTISWLMLFNILNVLLSDLKGQHPYIFYLIIVIVILIILPSIFLYYIPPQRTQVAGSATLRLLHDIRPRREYRLKIVSSQDDLNAAHFITHTIFGDRHPDDNWINSFYGDFTRPMTVLLLKKQSDDRPRSKKSSLQTHIRGYEIIGYASAWPLTDDAGVRMTRGVLDETGLKIADILNSNSEANYLYIPAIADLEASKFKSASNNKMSAAVRSSTILKIGLLDLLIDEFFIDDRPRKLIIDAWSKEGKNEMNALSKFTSTPRVESKNHHNENEDIFTLTITVGELRSARLVLLRRFAGVQQSLRDYYDGV